MQNAAARGDVVVVVDVLSFSTAVVAATEHGALVYPARSTEEGAAIAALHGAELAVNRRDTPARGRFSLSPLTLTAAKPGTRIVLPSPNGATCSRLGSMAPWLLVGALRNAAAVADAVERIRRARDLAVTVVACGERWPDAMEDEGMRVALEDLLGAGAILAGIDGDRSPEARAAVAAFAGLRADLAAVLEESGSGCELREVGFGEDVRYSAEFDASPAVPVLCDGAFRALEAE